MSCSAPLRPCGREETTNGTLHTLHPWLSFNICHTAATPFRDKFEPHLHWTEKALKHDAATTQFALLSFEKHTSAHAQSANVFLSQPA